MVVRLRPVDVVDLDDGDLGLLRRLLLVVMLAFITLHNIKYYINQYNQ